MIKKSPKQKVFLQKKQLRLAVHSQSGMALAAVLSLTALLFIFGAVTTKWVMSSSKDTHEEFRRNAQATNIAKAGLQDAIGWFKRKSLTSGAVSNPAPYTTDYPCADSAFKPVYSSDSQNQETIDANVGIVKDLILDEGRNLYGRYTIRKQPCSASTPYDIKPGMTGYDPLAVHDVTEERGKGNIGSGIVWRMASQGVIYQRKDFSKNGDGVFVKDPDEAPNKIVDSKWVGVEISRLSVRNPKAPVIVLENANGSSPGTSEFNNKCQVYGNNAQAGVIYNSTNPTNAPSNQFGYTLNRGLEAARDAALDPMSFSEVFALSKEELRNMADVTFSSQTDFYASYYDASTQRLKLPMALYYLEGDYTFDASHSLFGSGILLIDGNLTANAAGFSFSGLVYVTGTVTMKSDTSISGAVMAGKIVCDPGTTASIEYSESILERIRKALALYRESAFTYIKGQ